MFIFAVSCRLESTFCSKIKVEIVNISTSTWCLHYTMGEMSILNWGYDETANWLKKEGFDENVINILCNVNQVNGKCLLALNENDFTAEPLNTLNLRDRKCLYISIKSLQRENQNVMMELGLVELASMNVYSAHTSYPKTEISEYYESERVSPPASEDGRASKLPPEIGKAFLSLCYVIVVTWITAFVMVIVHDRVPDMKRYPPLPDIFLDNVPHIPWAFDMCEVTGTFLFSIWLIVLLFHKHR